MARRKIFLKKVACSQAQNGRNFEQGERQSFQFYFRLPMLLNIFIAEFQIKQGKRSF